MMDSPTFPIDSSIRFFLSEIEQALCHFFRLRFPTQAMAVRQRSKITGIYASEFNSRIAPGAVHRSPGLNPIKNN
jgi:hypothetical protein